MYVQPVATRPRGERDRLPISHVRRYRLVRDRDGIDLGLLVSLDADWHPGAQLSRVTGELLVVLTRVEAAFDAGVDAYLIVREISN